MAGGGTGVAGVLAGSIQQDHNIVQREYGMPGGMGNI
jgi:hypothetical protein